MPPILLPFLDGDDHAYNLVASYSSELWQLGIEGQIGDVVDALRLRLGVLVRQANTGQFIVYNGTRGLHDTTPSGAGRSLIFKYSRLFDLID